MLNDILGLFSFKDFSNLSDNDRKLIFDKVSYAISQTRSHISTTREGQNDIVSPIVANIWLRTARDLSVIKNKEVQILSRNLFQKSKYWTDTKNFDPINFEHYKIKLTQVEDSLSKICGITS